MSTKFSLNKLLSYIKVYLALFFVYTALICLIKPGLRRGVENILTPSFFYHRMFFSVLITLVIGTIQIRKFSALNKPIRIAFVRQSKTLVLPIPYEKALKICIDFLKTIDGCTISVEEHYAGKRAILGITKRTWWSTGKSIKIETFKIDANTTEFIILCKPQRRLLFNFDYHYIFDFGNSLEDVEKINAYLINNQ